MRQSNYARLPRVAPGLLCLISALLSLYAATRAAEITPTNTFVRVSPRDPRYFETSDGRPYLPIGLNMIAPPGADFRAFETWLDQLQANGGNFIRVWLSNPFFDVEDSRSGVYSEAKAAQIQRLLEAARARGVRVKLCLEHFRHLGEGKQTWAAKPLHRVTEGGTATNIADFFDGEPSRAQFKRKLAWFSGRFGSRPEIFGWELWNEINAVQGGDYLAWTEVMLPELHRLFPSNLAMQSLGSYDGEYARKPYERLARMPFNEVAQVHRYLDLGASLEVCKGPMDVLAADAVRELLRLNPGRPVLLAEGGAVEPGHSGPFKLYAADKEGMLLHDVLFAPFFAGAAGPGHIWHWDVYVARLGLWPHFRRFAEAVKELDPPAQGFVPVMLAHPRLRVYALRGASESLLWCRDVENTWRNELEQGRAPETLTGLQLNLAELKPIGGGDAKVRVYDPWLDHWSEAITREGKIVLPDFRRSLVVRCKFPVEN